MKPMTCLFRLMLVAYIFISSIILLKNYNDGSLTLSTWGHSLQSKILKISACECVKKTFDFLQTNFQNFLATLVFMSFFGVFFGKVTSMVSYFLIIIQIFTLDIKSLSQFLEPKTLLVLNQIISYLIVSCVNCALEHCNKSSSKGSCPKNQN